MRKSVASGLAVVALLAGACGDDDGGGGSDNQAAIDAMVAEGATEDEARRCVAAWPGYAVTPLVDLPSLAAALNIERLSYKDEGRRFGLRWTDCRGSSPRSKPRSIG